jgi:hypothetical protein
MEWGEWSSCSVSLSPTRSFDLTAERVATYRTAREEVGLEYSPSDVAVTRALRIAHSIVGTAVPEHLAANVKTAVRTRCPQTSIRKRSSGWTRPDRRNIPRVVTEIVARMAGVTRAGAQPLAAAILDGRHQGSSRKVARMDPAL